jgi:DNA-binding transcriptional MocR family regulator
LATPRPPKPDQIRRPDGGFSWIDQRFRYFWEDLSREELLLYYFLVQTANHEGVSWYSVRHMCRVLKIGHATLQRARESLEQRRLIATEKDDVRNCIIYQVLPLPMVVNERMEVPYKPAVQKKPSRTEKAKSGPQNEQPATPQDTAPDQHSVNMRNLERMKELLNKLQT